MLVVATYVLAGIAKLRIAGLEWIDGEQLRDKIALDNARKALLGDRTAPLASTFLEHPTLLTGFCLLTLAVELLSPLALIERVGRWWVLAAWGFHLGVVLTMNIWFIYPLAGFAILPFLAAERPVHWLIGWWRSRESARSAPGSQP
jgi:hypothetical protein